MGPARRTKKTGQNYSVQFISPIDDPRSFAGGLRHYPGRKSRQEDAGRSKMAQTAPVLPISVLPYSVIIGARSTRNQAHRHLGCLSCRNLRTEKLFAAFYKVANCRRCLFFQTAVYRRATSEMHPSCLASAKKTPKDGTSTNRSLIPKENVDVQGKRAKNGNSPIWSNTFPLLLCPFGCTAKTKLFKSLFAISISGVSKSWSESLSLKPQPLHYYWFLPIFRYLPSK